MARRRELVEGNMTQAQAQAIRDRLFTALIAAWDETVPVYEEAAFLACFRGKRVTFRVGPGPGAGSGLRDAPMLSEPQVAAKW